MWSIFKDVLIETIMANYLTLNLLFFFPFLICLIRFFRVRTSIPRVPSLSQRDPNSDWCLWMSWNTIIILILNVWKMLATRVGFCPRGWPRFRCLFGTMRNLMLIQKNFLQSGVFINYRVLTVIFTGDEWCDILYEEANLFSTRKTFWCSCEESTEKARWREEALQSLFF